MQQNTTGAGAPTLTHLGKLNSAPPYLLVGLGAASRRRGGGEEGREKREEGQRGKGGEGRLTLLEHGPRLARAGSDSLPAKREIGMPR